MIEFTEKQLTAIENIGGDVYVSAAAGSGKTAVLVERVIHIMTGVDNPVDADRLLVVTYTKSAAAEMSARIKKRIDRMLINNPNDAWLRRQSSLVKRMNVSTIHSFCMSILREYWNEAGIPCDFYIAAELFIDEMRELALERTAERLFSDEQSRFREYSDLFGRARSDRDALDTVERFERFLSDIAFPSGWKEECLRLLHDCIMIKDSNIGRVMLSYAAENINAAITMTEYAIEEAQKDDALLKAYSGALFDDLNYLYMLREYADKSDWDRCVEILRNYEPVSLKSAAKADPLLRESVKEIRNSVKNIIKNDLYKRFFQIDESGFHRDNKNVADSAEALFYATEIFCEELRTIKNKRKMFDYSDLERYTINLLEKDSRVRDDILSRYDYIFIDEYQDINEVQDYLFSLLKPNIKSLFAVGDIKQSIYRFRRAEPEIFIEKRKNAFDEESGEYPVHIPLSHNFRSRTEVIDAVNNVFSAVMTEQVGEIDYKEGERLTSASSESLAESGIEIVLVEDNRQENIEAVEIAKLISDMLSEGYKVNITSPDGSITSRNCRPGDFCVLLRARAKGPLIEESLKNAGIPVDCDMSDSFFQSSEIEILVSLLSVIDNPLRDVDMTAAMLSPLFGFTPDDIYNLKQSDRYNNLFPIMLKSDDERIKSFIKCLNGWRIASATNPVDELLSDIIDETEAELLLSAGDDYIKRRKNIRMLIEYSAGLSNEGGISLSRFLSFMQRQKRQGDTFSTGFTPSSDSVSILTIHRSKGLEWPIVILADAAKGFVYSDFRLPTVIFDRKLGIGIRHRVETDGPSSPLAMRNTIHYRAIAAHQERKMISEECRVLYVALTRAKQRIFIVSSTDDLDKTIPDTRKGVPVSVYTASKTKNHLSWILLSIDEDHRELVRALKENGSFSAGQITVRYNPPQTEIAQSASLEYLVPDPQIIKEINERISYAYPRSPLSAVPSKVSVSELSHDTSILYEAPSFFESTELSPASRGNAIHQFMQYADFKAVTKSIPNEVRRLTEKGFLSAGQASAVDIVQLETFFTGDLGKRVAAGKILREHAFIDTVNASELAELPDALSEEKIMVQGVVDCILFEHDGAVIIDYKSDRVTNGDTLVKRYSKQLALYKKAVEARFSIPVKECYIYSFRLGKAILL